MTNAIGLFAMQVVVYNPRTQSATADFLVKTIDGSPALDIVIPPALVASTNLLVAF